MPAPSTDLRVDTFPLSRGHVGLTLCPGRRGPSSSGLAPRDLGRDVAALARMGAGAVVTLIEPREMAAQQVPGLGIAIAQAGIDWLHLPITDACAPDAAWETAWRTAAPRLHRRIEAGGTVVIHCRAGLERSAMVAALLASERGEALDATLARIARARPGAGPTPVQRTWLERATGAHDRLRQATRACLLAGALGDALGAGIEFWSAAQIRARFPGGVDAFLPLDGDSGAFTDDTQMTLFTAEGLIRAVVRQAERGLSSAGTVHHAYLRWLVTQGEQPQVRDLCRVGLVADPRLHHRRAPGTTCLSALRAATGFGQEARNGSKGCGAVMRTAPVGLFRPALVDGLAPEIARFTHGHPTAAAAARAMSRIVADLLAGRDLTAALTDAAANADDAGTRNALRHALAAPRDGSAATVASLGAGWVADEALGIAAYAALTARDLIHGLQVAVSHGGDSDSTGAIAGNLLGLVWPDQVLAHPLRDQVVGADLILRLADDLHAVRSDPGDMPARALSPFYPGW